MGKVSRHQSPAIDSSSGEFTRPNLVLEQKDLPEDTEVSSKVNHLGQCLEAIAKCCSMQEARIIGPYPHEWNSVKYPSTSMVPTLNCFDNRGSPNLHIYYFKS